MLHVTNGDSTVETLHAFRAPDPTGLQPLLTSETSCLPFLAPAMLRHLEQFPGSRDGSSRSDRQILQAVAEAPMNAQDLFQHNQRQEEAPFAGDSFFFG